MDAEFREALTHWLVVQMKEQEGPSKRPGPDDTWLGFQGVNYIDQVLKIIVPEIAAEIEGIRAQASIHIYYDLWPLLPDRIIGVLMQAGAAKYLPPVEVS